MQNDIIKVTFSIKGSSKLLYKHKIKDRLIEHLPSLAEFLRKTQITSEYDPLSNQNRFNPENNMDNNFNDNHQLNLLELKKLINRNYHFTLMNHSKTYSTRNIENSQNNFEDRINNLNSNCSLKTIYHKKTIKNNMISNNKTYYENLSNKISYCNECLDNKKKIWAYFRKNLINQLKIRNFSLPLIFKNNKGLNISQLPLKIKNYFHNSFKLNKSFVKAAVEKKESDSWKIGINNIKNSKKFKTSFTSNQHFSNYKSNISHLKIKSNNIKSINGDYK